ncbi:MAG TPA: CarD family transcriptional regulator [Vicinamibacteria bacterium]|nr:CarD family transcriptional regulator [Vicinamibacteria bacterium]
MDFQVGEKVIYPNHGIGVVESIQARPVPGGQVSLYQLRILANDSRVWIPQQNADGVGLRRVVSTGDARKILNLLADPTIEQHSNWKGRFKENSDKMRTGSLYEVAVVLKGLTFLARKKALSFREKRMLDRAKFLLVSEIAEVEGKPHTSVEERVDKALARTFAVDPKPAAKTVQKPVGASRKKADA